MSEWKGNSSAQELRIGDIQAVAGVNGTAIVYASVERTAPRQLGMDAAKTAAEQALREMHDALSAHFAPVLRWDGECARLDGGRWILWANDRWFAVTAAFGGNNVEIVRREHTRTAIKARTLAEAILRELGVAFRVESES